MQAPATNLWRLEAWKKMNVFGRFI